MARMLNDSDKITEFGKVLREKKSEIDKEFCAVSTVLSELSFKHRSMAELEECILSTDEVLKSLNEFFQTIGTVKERCQEAKIESMKKQLRSSQIRDQTGRLLTPDMKKDSGCYSTSSTLLEEDDTRLLATSASPITHPTDANSDDEAPRQVPTQHEDTSDLVDSTC